MDTQALPQHKLEKLKALGEHVRIGGRGTARRKRKVVHKSAAADDKKLQVVLKRLNLNIIPGIEEVNMYKTDGYMIHFKNPKVQASPQANVFAVTGQAETKKNSKEEKEDDDDLPDLVDDFDSKCQNE